MRKAIAGLMSGALICSFAVVAHGQGKAKGKPFEGSGPPPWAQGVPNNPTLSFNRISTFANYRNGALGDETVSEIVAATADGNTLVYTDAETGKVGFVDITDPHDPQPLGLSGDLGGEPTSVDILGNDFALVGVNTSPSFVAPSGELAVLDVSAQGIVTTLDLGGQPDSLKISPDHQFAAVVIENERDEELGDGGLPQLPVGKLVIVDLDDPTNPFTWTTRDVDMTGLAGCYENADPEPEFVDINADNKAAVSLQENNCIAIVDLVSGAVENSFSAGTVDLDKIDATEDEDVIDQSESKSDIPREPDALTWVPAANGDYNIATANEGDLFGGSRGFSIFDQNGKVLFDSGNQLEHIAARIGHYPEGRSANKGTEPESIEFASFNPDLVFVGSERGSFVAVYELKGKANVVYRQSLPAPLGPEGVLAIPSRNLLVVSGEEDDPPRGVRSTMMIYELQSGQPSYPEILSDNGPNGTPIPWSAMSGLTNVPGSSHELLAVWDSFYDNSRVFTIDTSTTPARVTAAMDISDPYAIGEGNFDPEGVDVAPDGSIWVASEANASRKNRLLKLNSIGELVQEVELPAAIRACRKTTNDIIGAIEDRIEELDDLGGDRTDDENDELDALEA
ncbi:MAG: esterase-like activity of phytase family protein, partial [Gammaproteobacteria bacterium]